MTVFRKMGGFKVMFAGVVLAYCAVSQAQTANQRVYYPQVFFDKKTAANALSKGSSTIRGSAFAGGGGLFNNTRNRQYAKSNTLVTLFPVTPYFTEWYELKKRYSRHWVQMTPEAFAHRIEAKTDEYGNFQFTKLQAGVYYVEAIVDYVAKGSETRQTGTNVNCWAYYAVVCSETPTYQTFYYDYDTSAKASTFVEVTQNGQLVDVELRTKRESNGGLIGALIRSVNSSSERAPECYYQRNRWNGTCRKFTENGQLEQESELKDNLKDGELRFYYPSGRIRQVDRYKKDVPHGESVAYREDGSVLSKVLYQSGVMVTQ